MWRLIFYIWKLQAALALFLYYIEYLDRHYDVDCFFIYTKSLIWWIFIFINVQHFSPYMLFQNIINSSTGWVIYILKLGKDFWVLLQIKYSESDA
jgi:hypothetical protein